MAHSRSITFNRTMAIALAAGVGISGLAIAPSYSGVSLVPSAYAQENGGENKMIELKAGETASIASPTYEDGSDPLPDAEFSAAEGNPEWVTVNEDGTVTVEVPEGTDVGDYDYGVVITGPGREPTTVTATITVVEDDVVEAPEVIFRGDATLNPGDVWDSEAPIYQDGIPLPENTSFIPSDNNPEWIVVNEDGSVTVTVPEDQGSGEFTYEFDMAVSVVDLAPIITPLGGTITINEIEEPDTPLDIVFNGDVELDPGTQVVIDSPVYDDGTDLPDGTEFEGTEDNPDWVEVNEDGTITVNVHNDQEPGDYDYDLIVTVPGEDPVNLGGTITVNEQEPTEDPTEEPTTTSTKDDVDKTPTRTVSVSVTAKPVDGNNNTGSNNTGDNNSSSDKGKDTTKYGPKVKTGGTVENVSFLDKIKSFFSA